MAGSHCEHVVLVDMDNTLVDYDREFARRWKEIRPEDDVQMIYKRKYFEIEKTFDKEVIDVVHRIMKSDGFFLKLKAFEGGIEALREMESLGLHVILCSSPSLFQYEACASAKFAWVREHLGQEWLSRLLLTRDKTLVKGRVLIDDKPSIKGRCSSPEWTQVIFEQSYNLGVNGPRLTAWKDWKKVLSPFFPQIS